MSWLLTPTNGLPFLLSFWTMLCMYTAGHNPRRGWLLALIGQGLWIAYTYYADAWGFIPLNIGLTVIYARNLMRARVVAPSPRPDKLWYVEKMLSVALSECESYRKPLAELVALKDLKIAVMTGDYSEASQGAAMAFDYEHRRSLAWAAARQALSQEWEASAGGRP